MNPAQFRRPSWGIPLLLAIATLALPLAGFSCYQTYDPCDPPCTDDDAIVNFFIGHDHLGCACTCEPEHMVMTISFLDPDTKEMVKQKRFTNVGSDIIATTTADIPTCRDLLVRVKWQCFNSGSSMCVPPPVYVIGFYDVPAIPCGEQRNIPIDISCTQILDVRGNTSIN